MRILIIDTAATIVFFTVVASLTELFIAGMGWREVATTRLAMVPIMVLTARPYTFWRDALFRRFKPMRRLAHIIIDITAFVSFQAPVYLATLLFAGAEVHEVLIAVSSAVIFMVLLARPFGLYIESVRILFRKNVDVR
ncbi:MAG: L-alanine exporter AlaE [Pseudomonadota bacterium]